MYIALAHGISPTEVYFSTWRVVDAARNNRNFNIDFPKSNTDQKEIDRKLKEISDVDFDTYCGCADGLFCVGEQDK